MFFPVLPGMPGIGIITTKTSLGPGIFNGPAITGNMANGSTITLRGIASNLPPKMLFSHNQILL
jgi:hypothetical protein